MPGKESAPCKQAREPSSASQHHNWGILLSPDFQWKYANDVYIVWSITIPPESVMLQFNIDMLLYIFVTYNKGRKVTMHKKITSPQHMDIKSANPGTCLADT